MIYEYVLLKDGYQGRGKTELTEMGKVESTSPEGAILAVEAVHGELVKDGANVVFIRPEASVTMIGTVLT